MQQPCSPSPLHRPFSRQVSSGCSRVYPTVVDIPRNQCPCHVIQRSSGNRGRTGVGVELDAMKAAVVGAIVVISVLRAFISGMLEAAGEDTYQWVRSHVGRTRRKVLRMYYVLLKAHAAVVVDNLRRSCPMWGRGRVRGGHTHAGPSSCPDEGGAPLLRTCPRSAHQGAILGIVPPYRPPPGLPFVPCRLPPPAHPRATSAR